MDAKTFEELVFKDGIRLGESPYDPTKLTIDQGTDAVFDELFSAATYNKIKNHWRTGIAEAAPADGMIQSLGTGKLQHRSGGWEEILQLTRSADVSPLFMHLGLGGAAIDADIGINFDERMTDVDNSEKIGMSTTLQARKIMAADMTSKAQGIYGVCLLDSTNTQNWVHTIGLRSIHGFAGTEAGSAGIITGIASFVSSANIANAATVTSLYGLYIGTPTVGGNKVTNEYGIYIATQNTGLTLNYAIYTNAGLVRFGDNVSVAGHIGVGAGISSQPTIGIYYAEALTDVDNTSKTGFYTYLQVAKTTVPMTQFGQGVYGACGLDSTNTQNWTHAIAGLRGVTGEIITEALSAGTVTGAACFVSQANIVDAATITSLYGLYIGTPTVAGTKVTNEYGIYIANQNTGLTLNYAIYTNAGVVRLGDIVFMTGLKSGINQGAAGAAATELWHDTTDNTIKIGV